MAKVLHIDVSPRKSASRSREVAKAFLDAYRAAHPADTIETIDLWSHDLPAFDGPAMEGKYAVMSGRAHNPEETKAWQRVTAEAERFKAADKYLFSVPMWNFGVPYKLKHYIDVITQPGLMFSWSPDKGFVGLVTGKPVAMIYASSGDYRPGSGAEGIDFQKPYLDWILKFWGFETVHTLRVAPTAGPDPVAIDRTVAAAKAEAAALAKTF